MASGKQNIISLPLSASQSGDTLDMSFWYFVDGSRYGGPRWKISCKEDGKKSAEASTYALHMYDTQDGWLRVAMDILIPKGADELSLTSDYKFNHRVDDIMVKQKSQNIKSSFQGQVYYNNYKIKE